MKTLKNIEVLFVAGFGPIVRDPAASRKFYSDALGLEFKEDASGYMYTGELDGVKHFALWPLAQAAESCFDTDQWPGNLAVPQAWIEFQTLGDFIEFGRSRADSYLLKRQYPIDETNRFRQGEIENGYTQALSTNKRAAQSKVVKMMVPNLGEMKDEKHSQNGR